MSEFDDITPEEREEIENSDTREGREKKDLVSLSGFARTESGKMTKSNYFRFLNHNLDDYSDIQFTPGQARSVHQHLLKLSTGASAMTPMFCAGPSCPFQDRCILQQMGKAPIGKQCITEVELMKQWQVDYFDEFDVDPNNFTEIGYVNELAELQILEMRLNMNLARAENAELVVDQVVGVDREGTPMIQKDISPFILAKEKLANRRSKIIKLMVGDRQEKYKMESALKVKVEDDPSNQMANMRANLDNLAREMNKVEAKAKDKSLSPEDLMGTSE